MADKAVKVTKITRSDGFNYHSTSYENSGKPGDKGSRTSSDWESKEGGWVKLPETTHKTNQNVGKKSPKRHK